MSEAELSFAQQRLWFLDQMAPGQTGYSMFESYRLRGRLDTAALRLALADTMQRHSVLRTTFHAQRGKPYQVVHESVPAPFEVITPAGLSPAEREIAAGAVVEQEIQRPFELHEGPLLRLTAIQLEPAHHLLLVVIHHIVTDDWSMAVFWRDLGAFYLSRTTGEPARLPELPVQYVDYAAWQRQWLQGEALAVHLDHWKQHLDGAPQVLELPADRSRPAQQRGITATVHFRLPGSVTGPLYATAKSANATSFMALLSVFALTLERLTGRSDLVIGTFTGNRPVAEVENLVGLFVNTLALRVQCGDSFSFAELLAVVRSSALDAYRHQELPFDQLVTALRPPRDLSRNPIAQVAFQLLGPVADRVQLPGIVSTPLDLGQGASAFDLQLEVRDTSVGPELAPGPGSAVGLEGKLHYDADLFTETTARAFADEFIHVATTVAASVTPTAAPASTNPPS